MASNDIAIVTLVLQQMTLLESRLGGKIDRMEASATGRWTNHEVEHASIDKALKAFGHRLDDHLKDEEREQLIFDARMGPLRRMAAWSQREWRTLVIILLLIIDGIGQLDGMFHNIRIP